MYQGGRHISRESPSTRPRRIGTGVLDQSKQVASIYASPCDNALALDTTKDSYTYLFMTLVVCGSVATDLKGGLSVVETAHSHSQATDDALPLLPCTVDFLNLDRALIA